MSECFQEFKIYVHYLFEILLQLQIISSYGHYHYQTYLKVSELLTERSKVSILTYFLFFFCIMYV